MAKPIEKEEGLIILGTVGNRKDPQGILTPADGYTASLRRVPVSEQELVMGDLTYDLFMGKFHRPQPWYLDTKSGIVVDTGLTRRAIDQALAANPDQLKIEAPITMKVLRLDALRGERIDENLARNIDSAIQTERGLSDFSKTAQEEYGRSRGEAMGYLQWSREEGYHADVQEEILTRVEGGRTPAELDRERKELLRREWVSPFTTRRRTAIYAALQEPMTAAVYVAEAARAQVEAPTAAHLLRLVASDEWFHGAWFGTGGVTVIYAMLDPEGTEQDVYFVARRFRMPADYYFLEPKSTMKAFRLGMGYSNQSFARRLYEFMNRFTFVDKNKTLLVAAEYGGTAEGIGKSEIDDLLQWPRQKLAEVFETDDRLKAARYNTQTKVLAPNTNKMFL